MILYNNKIEKGNSEYDMEEVKNYILDFCKTYSLNDVEKAERLLFNLNKLCWEKYKLIIKYDLDEYQSEESGVRCILCYNNKANKKNYWANGIVFRLHGNPVTLSVLSYPMKKTEMFVYNMESCRKVLENKNYAVYPLLDGTIVNMYWDEFVKEWAYATSGCANIAKLSWRGHTYQSLIKEAMSGVSYDTLDKNNTYMYNIYNNKIHYYPLMSADGGVLTFVPYRAVLINVIDKSGNSVGHPEKLKHLDLNLERIVEIYNTTNSYVKEVLKGKSMVYPDFMGVIFRSSNPDEPAYACYSDLFKNIKNLIYQCPKYGVVSNYDSAIYVSLLNYFDLKRHNNFCRLFYRHLHVFEKISNFIDRMTEKIYYDMVIKDPLLKKLRRDKYNSLMEILKQSNTEIQTYETNLYHYLNKKVHDKLNTRISFSTENIKLSKDLIRGVIKSKYLMQSYYECITNIPNF